MSANEPHDAEIRRLKSCQATHFPDEIASIKQYGSNSRLPMMRQLRLYLGFDGIICCGGRIHNTPLEQSGKFLYLLPKKHELTQLIVFDAHTRQLHSGVNSTITQLRWIDWIPSIRQCVRSFLRPCVKCARVISNHTEHQTHHPYRKSKLKKLCHSA